MARTVFLRAIGLAVVLASAAAGPAQAAPTWLDATLPFGDVASRPADARAAMAPDGTIVIARYAPDGALEVRERPPGGPVGQTITIPAVTVDPQPFPNLQVLAGADGTAAVLFDAGSARYASMRAPGGGWTRPEIISLAGTSPPQAAIAPDGVLWIVGRVAGNEIAVAVSRMTAAGRVQITPLPLPPPGAQDSGRVLTTSPGGDAHVLYSEFAQITDAPRCTRRTAVLEVDVSARGYAGPATTLDSFDFNGQVSDDGCDIDSGKTILDPIGLATDADGADTAVYSVFSVASESVTTLARHRDPGGGWPAREQPAEVVTDADVTLDRLVGGPGAPLLVVRGTFDKAITTRRPDGVWTPLEPLIDIEGARSFDVARTGTGTTVFAWVEGIPPRRVIARVAGADGVLGDPHPLTEPGPAATLLSVGGDAAGDATAVYTRSRDTGFELAMDGYDAAGPRLTSVSVPPRAVAGLALPFSVAGLDVWSGPLTTAAWNFGDGGHGNGLVVGHAFSSAGQRTVQVRVEDGSGNATTASRQLTVAGPPGPLPAPSAPPGTTASSPRRDARAPVLTGVSVSPRHARAGRPLTLAITTDEADSLSVALAETAPGVSARDRCVARSRRHPRGTQAARGRWRAAACPARSPPGPGAWRCRAWPPGHGRSPPGSPTPPATARAPRG
jgi:hypothetical protein